MDIIYCQGIDRDMYGTSCISTTYLNEICSNKLQYIKCLTKYGLMINTRIIDDIIDMQGSNDIVKLPYSSRSACVARSDTFNKDKLVECYTGDGYIVQKYHHFVGLMELKCHCLDGEVYAITLRIHNGDKFYCTKPDLSNNSWP